MTDKLRKYVLHNIPYVFIGWVFLKLGTAYRLAAGGDFAHKFIGLGQTVGAAFPSNHLEGCPVHWASLPIFSYLVAELHQFQTT